MWRKANSFQVTLLLYKYLGFHWSVSFCLQDSRLWQPPAVFLIHSWCGDCHTRNKWASCDSRFEVTKYLSSVLFSTTSFIALAVLKEGVSHIQEFVKRQDNSRSGSVRMINNLLHNNRGGFRSNSASSFNTGRPVLGSGKWQYSQIHAQPTFVTSGQNSFQPRNSNV